MLLVGTGYGHILYNLTDPNLISVLNTPECDRNYDSTYDGSACGTNYARSALDSDRCWTPDGTVDNNQWNDCTLRLNL